MPRYRYIGPGPVEVISGGELTRPGDEREFDTMPDWGPWELAGEPGPAPEPSPAPPAPFSAPPVTPEGNM